ncbi:tRNA aspartic acid methyltransferase 1 [Fasciolopsis buskii]|uniref:tRNA aspartic acid methyltransferase 1 n=1 Tax=Fasciolopsis buskii TaxID=27845 RepID=A0A8E0RZY5_9TREM|nr:tRNA aspartic acid methyltransferase 1 [Fasciolopsis buski]
MRVLELYSGIGGIRCAIEKSTLPYSIRMAVDINDLASAVYNHNFPQSPACNRVIESLSVSELSRLHADLWTMSPPCQPFTRLGNKMCEADSRSESLFHVLTLIAAIRPRFIFLENVKGFETSESCYELLKTLDSNNYLYQQFLLSPLQFGIPNCRLRFYLVAWRGSEYNNPFNGQSSTPCILDTIPRHLPSLPDCTCPFCTGCVQEITTHDKNFTEYLAFCQPVANFLRLLDEAEERSCSISDDCLRRYFFVMDIVRPCDRKTRCFTKGYTKRIEGTGSVLQTSRLDLTFDLIHNNYKSMEGDSDALVSFARTLGLRFFHSREVANLMCFPSDYEFPENVTEKQRIRLLGNSVNVHVVAHLIFWAFGTQSEAS